MAFDQEVRDYLERLELPPTSEEVVQHRHIDEHHLRYHFLSELRGLEEYVPRPHIEEVFATWSPRIVGFARYLETVSNLLLEEEAVFARRALEVGIGIHREGMALVDVLEYQRIVDDFERRWLIEPYTLECRLTGREARRLSVSGLGRAFLQLQGKDAIRWLLTIEIAQSRGPSDVWRTPRQLLEEAVSAEGIVATLPKGKPVFPYSAQTLWRLVRLGVLTRHWKASVGYDRYTLVESARDVVEGVIEAGPWHTAVSALLDDMRPATLQALGPRATEVAIEQTRLIAHEVRNALIPVRYHVDALLASSEGAHHPRLATARRGVVRVLDFVDSMVSTSELLNEAFTSFELGELIREAVGQHEEAERVEIVLASPMRLRAPRWRLLRVISNIVLNALQATGDGQRVRVQTRMAGGRVEIMFDDGGPGVPEESRADIFQDGFTTRGGRGGSGFGLAFSRRVIEETLHGKVWCEASDLGGARFVISIPEGKA